MEIIFKGVNLDPQLEHEIFAQGEYGMTIKVEFNENGIRKGYNASELHNNVTEFHYDYPSPFRATQGKQAAFESDLHGTGCTRYVNDLKRIEITIATEMAEEF
jgi:hypothetical protein